MNVFRIPGVVLIAIAMAIGVGCGGDDNKDNATTTETTQTTEPAAETSTVKMDEYQFTPGDVVAKQGDSIDVSNDGKIVHNLTVEKGPDPKKESDKLTATDTLTPGKSEKLKVDIKPGKYVMVCTVAGHRELGMTGTFTVK